LIGRTAAIAVELADESGYPHVAQPADLEELAGLLSIPLAASSAIDALSSTAVRVRRLKAMP
jgi:hypothetical protein